MAQPGPEDKMKKLIITLSLLFVFSISLYSFEVGIIGGTLTKPSHNLYGLSGSMGLFVPMLKLELEIWRYTSVDYPAYKNGGTLGVKFKPTLGKFSPYAVLGIGADFDTLGFQFDEYDKFTFIGGGVYLKLAAMISIRGDARFFNYTGYNRARVSAGVFFSF